MRNTDNKIAIMQPYFFPYPWYFKLIDTVDIFVFLDDVNYIKRGYINRNKIRNRRHTIDIRIPLSKSSQNKRINNIKINDYTQFKAGLLKTYQMCYSRSNYFMNANELLDNTLCSFTGVTVSDFNIHSTKKIMSYLGIATNTLRSSALSNSKLVRGEDRLFDICKQIGAFNYYNLPGGRELYSYDRFAENNISLNFLEESDIQYTQFAPSNFISNLSILDFLAFGNNSLSPQKFARNK